MEGINLSSSIPEQNKRKSFLSSGTFWIIFLFLSLLALWGGMLWYLGTLDQILLQKKSILSESANKVKGKAVDRIVDLNNRVKISTDQSISAVDTNALLSQLESLVIANFRLTSYVFDKTSNTISIKGETDNFKYVAQQMAFFKKNPNFKNITLDTVDRKDGIISFSFKSTF